jgi:hypothetical protein
MQTRRGNLRSRWPIEGFARRWCRRFAFDPKIAERFGHFVTMAGLGGVRGADKKSGDK